MPASSFQKHHRNSVHDYVALDIETLGLQPSTKILSIGVVRVRDGQNVQELELFPAGWELYEIPYGHPTDRHLLTQMHRQSQANNTPTSEVLRMLADFLGNDVIVGQNIARFDLPVISHWHERHDLPPLSNHFVDLLPLARKTYPDLPNHKLETLTRHHRLGTVAHTALSDAVQEHLLYERMKSDMREVPVVVNPNWRKRTPLSEVMESVTEVKQSPLSGSRICVTGEFPNRTREDVWAELTSLGITPQASITAKTDYLLVGDWGVGPVKLATAGARKIQILTWQQLQSLLAAPSTTSSPDSPVVVEQQLPVVESPKQPTIEEQLSTKPRVRIGAVVDPEWSSVVVANVLVGDTLEHNGHAATIRRRGMLEFDGTFYYSLREFSDATGGRPTSGPDQFTVVHGAERWIVNDD